MRITKDHGEASRGAACEGFAADVDRSRRLQSFLFGRVEWPAGHAAFRRKLLSGPG